MYEVALLDGWRAAGGLRRLLSRERGDAIQPLSFVDGAEFHPLGEFVQRLWRQPSCRRIARAGEWQLAGTLTDSDDKRLPGYEVRPFLVAQTVEMPLSQEAAGPQEETFADPPRVGSPLGRGRLPTFLVIGANKAGTTSLWKYLSDHPQVFMSRVKEPHWFCYQGTPPEGQSGWLLPESARAIHTLDDYRRLFEDAGAEKRALGEASTGYLTAASVPGRVRSVLPDARLIAVLRHPAERAWSEWSMMHRHKVDSREDLGHILTTEPTSRYLALGRYGRALTTWLQEFPRAQMRIYLFEELIGDPEGTMQDVYDFIGVEPFRASSYPPLNVDPAPIPLPAALRERLVASYLEDITTVEAILGRALPDWRR